jgi:hypothetical protein
MYNEANKNNIIESALPMSLDNYKILLLTICFSSIALQCYSRSNLLNLHTTLDNGDKNRQESIFTPQQWRAVKTLGALAASGLIAHSGNGTHSSWLTKVCNASCLALTIGYGFEQEQLVYWGLRAPLVAVLGKAIACDSVQKPFAKIPVFGPLLSSKRYDSDTSKWEPSCSEYCQGTCGQCGPLQTVLAIGVYCTFKPYFDKKIEDLQEWLWSI